MLQQQHFIISHLATCTNKGRSYIIHHCDLFFSFSCTRHAESHREREGNPSRPAGSVELTPARPRACETAHRVGPQKREAEEGEAAFAHDHWRTPATTSEPDHAEGSGTHSTERSGCYIC